MVTTATFSNLQQRGAAQFAQVESFAKEHRELLQTIGVVTVAVLAGGVGGYYLAKGAFVVKGVAVTKGGAAVAPVLTAQSVTNGVATLQSTATMLSNSLVSGAALVDKAAALLNTLSTNAIPLTAGALGGGAAGVGATRYQVRKIQDALTEQEAQTATAHAERNRLAEALTLAQSTLHELQTKVASPPPAPSAQDDLEQIKGIGRVFAQKLNAAGIYTMADLAAQTPERLREIIGATRGGVMAQPADWIQQAQQQRQGSGTSTTNPGVDVDPGSAGTA